MGASCPLIVALALAVLVVPLTVSCSASENAANVPTPDAGATADGNADAADGNVLFVRQINAFIGGGSPDTCLLDFEPQDLVLLSGTLDVAFRHSYDASLVVGYRQASSDASSVRLALERVVVRIEDMPGHVVWGPNETTLTGFIDGVPGSAGYGGTEVGLIGADYGARLAQELGSSMGTKLQLRSIIRVLGRTLDGVPLESEEWGFPITACYGCLVVYPYDAVDPALPRQPNCGRVSAPGAVARGCRVGQDDIIDCRVCKELDAANPICEPPLR
jgi:hypothetical protein